MENDNGVIWIMIVKRVPFIAVLVVGSVSSALLGNDSKNVNSVDGYASDIVKKVIAKGCSKKYSVTCFKMDVVHLVDFLSETKSYQLFPGVAIVRDNLTEDGGTRKLPDALIRSLASGWGGENRQLDEYLIRRISEYLSSHSVSLKLLDPQTAQRAMTLANNTGDAEGRAKGTKGHGTLMAGMMMMKGTLMMMGFGALAALAGKALLTSLIALMLSALIGLKSHHHDGGHHHAHKQTTYEIISKPIYGHHTHSAEIQHNHDHAHIGYSYGRNLDYMDGGTLTKTAEVEYIPMAVKDDEDYSGNRMRAYDSNKVEYKTISDSDVKNYYNFVNQNQDHKQRKQKSYPDVTTREVDDKYFVPLTTALPAINPK